jgi:hypothetical protein
MNDEAREQLGFAVSARGETCHLLRRVCEEEVALARERTAAIVFATVPYIRQGLLGLQAWEICTFLLGDVGTWPGPALVQAPSAHQVPTFMAGNPYLDILRHYRDLEAEADNERMLLRDVTRRYASIVREGLRMRRAVQELAARQGWPVEWLSVFREEGEVTIWVV